MCIGDSQRDAVDTVGEILRPDAKFCAVARQNVIAREGP
jgi:hypothetical protein